MNLTEIALSASQAIALLAAFPFTWLLLVVVFLVLVEGLMFIPYVGFIAKICIASLVAAQVLVLFAAASAGEPPQLGRLVEVFWLPLSAQVALVACALLPFLAGLVYLSARGGVESIAFFFGNILDTRPPAPRLFFVFKSVMYVAALPFTFVAAAVTLQGLSGWEAVAQGVLAAAANWPALLVLLAISFVFEWSSVKLALLSPRSIGVALTGIMLVAFLAWSFSFVYALSVRALPAAMQTQGLS